MLNNRFMQWLLLATPALMWAGNFTVARAVRDTVPPLTLSFGRWAIALACLLPFCYARMCHDLPKYRAHWRLILGASVVGIVLFNSLIYYGVHYTTSTNGLLLNSTIPVLIAIIGFAFYHRKLNAWQCLGLIISLSGVVTIIVRGDWHILVTLSFNRGDILMFIAMICWALYTLWLKQIPADIDRIGLIGAQIVIAMPILFICALIEYSAAPDALILNRNAILALLYVGILPSVVAYLLYTFAISKLGPVKAGMSTHLVPVFGIILALLFLGEHLHLFHVVGIALIVAGIFLVTTKKAA